MDETKLKVLEEKLDCLLDLAFMIHAALYPNTAYKLTEFSDGSGRFLPAADVDNKGVTDDE